MLIASYLEKRKQVVRIREEISSEKEVNYGVPRGTILGPILLIIFINNILTASSVGEILSFADDTVVLYTTNTWSELKKNNAD